MSAVSRTVRPSRPTTAGDSEPRHESQQISPLRMGHLQQLRIMLDELAVKLDARDCLERNNRHRYAARIQVESEFTKFLESMQDLVSSHLGSAGGIASSESSVAGSVSDVSQVPVAASKDGSVRIQLKLSPALVRVLQAVRQENVKASQFVEEVLWEAPRVQDTASLAGIQRPVRLPAA